MILDSRSGVAFTADVTSILMGSTDDVTSIFMGFAGLISILDINVLFNIIPKPSGHLTLSWNVPTFFSRSPERLTSLTILQRSVRMQSFSTTTPEACMSQTATHTVNGILGYSFDIIISYFRRPSAIH